MFAEETTTDTTDTPRVYLACLASYNNGTIHGRWVDATDVNEIREELAELLRESPHPNVFVACPECDGIGCEDCGDRGKVPSAEEWAIRDYEGFASLRIEEYEDLERVAELGAAIKEHGEAFAAFADHVGVDYATTEKFEEAYLGRWEGEKEYAEHLFDELYGHAIPEDLRRFIDYDAYRLEIFDTGDRFSVPEHDGGGVHVFVGIL